MKTKNFRKWINDVSRDRGPIILALDYTFHEREMLYHKSVETLRAVSQNICGVKINHQLSLPLGLYPKIKEIIDIAHVLGLPVIMDCKINDVGSTNREIARHYYDAGFDAVIANPFVGWEEGLEPVFITAKKREKGVILLVYMSHRSSVEGYGQKVVDLKTGGELPQYIVFAKKALIWNADGVIVGATYPEKISEVNRILEGRIPIYSPGVGVQGGDAKSALDAGTRFLIVGRSIIFSKDPEETARKFRGLVN
jgi:orotidine-5'-phosphate decarboxylase